MALDRNRLDGQTVMGNSLVDQSGGQLNEEEVGVYMGLFDVSCRTVGEPLNRLARKC